MDIIIYILLALILLAVLADIFITISNKDKTDFSLLSKDIVNELSSRQNEAFQNLKSDIKGDLNTVINVTYKSMGEFKDFSQMQITNIQRVLSERLKSVDEGLVRFSRSNEERLEAIRTTINSRLESIQQDNNIQLEKMRDTVDEKLQKTLNERISQSFQLVNERLEQVQKGLGEMQSLAVGVGDLKKVLSNVKTRGIMGEYQLFAILEEILSKEQYEQNFITKIGTQNRVEFAIKLPGDEGKHVYLPIDAKFPVDAYSHLLEAYEAGSSAEIATAGAVLETRIKGFAKDIREKYIDTPNTTDFAIMFLPFEGLYSEVIRRGLLETLQNTYKVTIAGPTTMAAILNSLQMGFKTLAIQKRSGEVWAILGEVKTEFETFSGILESAQKRIELAGKDLDQLRGVRTRKINQKLQSVNSPALIEELISL